MSSRRAQRRRFVTNDSHDTERALLWRSLAAQRAHALGILDGLDDQALHLPVLPSGWSCAALVHHLAIDEERFWFRAVMAGDRTVIASFASAESAWRVDASTPAQEVIDLYRREIALADAVIAETQLDTAPAWWPEDLFGSFRLANLREVLLHMIVEVACHAGHLDAVRELLDGRQWLVLDEPG